MDVIAYSPHELGRIGGEIDNVEDLDSQYDDDQEEELSLTDGVSTTDNDDTSVANIEDENYSLPLRRSLFANVPPYVAFQSYDSTKIPNLPRSLRKHMKWRLTTITPLLVRKTLVNTGYRLVKKSPEWCAIWGKHMKSACFKTIKENQKINHFPGTFQVGRKDRLWRSLSRMMIKHGRKEFGFAPRTYVLPQDFRCFRQVWEKTGGKEKWIIKPPASARGTGIKVVHKWSQIPKKKPVIVQQYLSKPKLIGGAKFDLRLYVLVSSFNPLRIYIYPDGLVRFASVKYVDDINYLSDRFMHLTNYSINKSSATYTSNDCADSCRGHKWTVKALWSYLEKENVNTEKLWAKIKDIIVKTMIAGESSINSLTRCNTTSRYCCYELFGIDILLDENLKPWLLEVNISPSLQSSSPLDIAVKGPLIRNVFNIAGYQVSDSMTNRESTNLAKVHDLELPIRMNTQLHKTALTEQEKQKQLLYTDLTSRDDYLFDILEDLTPDDVRHLVAYEDELTQIGNFEKIFPTPTSHEYFQFFDVQRYHNMLLDAWEDQHADDRQKGIARLQSLCKMKFHLNATTDT